MKTCSKCILPETHPDVELTNTTCNFCNHFQESRLSKVRVKGHEQLQQLLESEKRGKYDCVIGLSGGKDSSFILYYMVKIMKLNPLAVFFNNGLVVPEALKNVKEMCAKLNVDLETGYATMFRRKIVKKALLLSKLRGKHVSHCVNCENNIRSFSLNMAKKYNVPFLIWGSTDYEDSTSSYTNSDKEAFKKAFEKKKSSFKKIFKKAANIFRSDLSYIKIIVVTYHHLLYRIYTVIDNLLQKAPVGLKVLDPKMGVSFFQNYTQVVYFFDYLPYDPIHMIEILKKEIGWQAPEGRESRMDCKLHTVSNFMHWKRTGVTKDGFGMSALIRAKLMNKDEAIRREEILLKNIIENTDKVAEEMGVKGLTDSVYKK